MNITHLQIDSIGFYTIIFFHYSGKGFDISYTHYFNKTFYSCTRLLLSILQDI